MIAFQCTYHTVTWFMTGNICFSDYTFEYIFVFMHFLLYLSCYVSFRLNGGSFPRTGYTRKPVCRIIYFFKLIHYKALWMLGVWEKVRIEREIIFFYLPTGIYCIVAHSAAWHWSLQLHGLSESTRPSLWEMHSWTQILQGCLRIYVVEGYIPIWDPGRCRTRDLRVQWHPWLLLDTEDK